MYWSSKVGGFLKMRYRGIRPENERMKNKIKVYSLIQKHQGSTLSELIDLAKPMAKDTVVACLRELVKDSKNANALLLEMMIELSDEFNSSKLKKDYDEIIEKNKMCITEHRLGNRKIYTSFDSKNPMASVAQSAILSLHRLIEDDIIKMKSYDLPLKDKKENARDNLDTVCNILWELITSEIEYPTKIRFTKEIRECRKRIKTIFDIVKKDPDADKILPHLYPMLVRKPTLDEKLMLHSRNLASIPISPSIIDMYLIFLKNIYSD